MRTGLEAWPVWLGRRMAGRAGKVRGAWDEGTEHGALQATGFYEMGVGGRHCGILNAEVTRSGSHPGKKCHWQRLKLARGGLDSGSALQLQRCVCGGRGGRGSCCRLRLHEGDEGRARGDGSRGRMC